MDLKILVVSDHESEFIWDYFDRSAFAGVKAVVSCGDLDPAYLSFLATMLPVPLLYVRGNHDDRYQTRPPEGCIDLEARPVTIGGVRFLGFGGCKSASPRLNHYTERAMAARVTRTTRRLTLRKGGFDVLVTHVSAAGLGDGEDRFHEGFACYRALIDRFQPAYHLHGHQHLSYGVNTPRTLQYGQTVIINGYNYCIVDLHIPEPKGGKRA